MRGLGGVRGGGGDTRLLMLQRPLTLTFYCIWGMAAKEECRNEKYFALSLPVAVGSQSPQTYDEPSRWVINLL